MTRKLILCFFMLLTIPTGSLFAQKGTWQAGIEGGPGLSLVYAGQGVYSHSRPSLAGAAGIFGEYGFARDFSVKLAVQYERVSTRTDNYSVLFAPGGRLQDNLDYLSVPVLVKWSFGDRVRFYVNAGPCLSLLLRETLMYVPDSGGREKAASDPNAYRFINLAVTAGIGMAIPVGKSFDVTLELRDNLGVLNIRTATSGFEHKSYFVNAEPKGFTNSTLLLAGFSYRFGGSEGLPCTPDDPDFQYIKK